MQSVKSCDMGPEMIARRLLHGLGYGYRFHRKDLPGDPAPGVRDERGSGP